MIKMFEEPRKYVAVRNKKAFPRFDGDEVLIAKALRKVYLDEEVQKRYPHYANLLHQIEGMLILPIRYMATVLQAGDVEYLDDWKIDDAALEHQAIGFLLKVVQEAYADSNQRFNKEKP